MSHIEINREEFEKLLGEHVNDETLKEKASYLGAHWNHVEGKKWDIEVYPDRPDLLSVEGLARAYQGFFGIETGLRSYDVEKGELKIEVDESVENVRPFIGGAVIRDVNLDERTINGLIQLQEKIHQTMGRRRDKLAIGLHDLSDLEAPFTYKAVEPGKVSFTPLEYDRDMQLGEIVDEHEKGQKYSWILEDEDQYPIIQDSKGKVLSFPPIINNQLTEVTEDTVDIFIDVTGKDKQTVLKALNILTTSLAERDGAIESVEVAGEKMPNLASEERTLSTEYVKDISGLELDAEETADLLEKMRFEAEPRGDKIVVKVPCYRNDIMHDYDLIEDIVIAYGYNDISSELPDIDQIGEEKDIEKFVDVVRQALIGAGALEAHTFILSSRKKLFENMGVEESPHAAMNNALTEDYEVVRNWLTPSLLEVLRENRHHSYPQEFFEAGEVVETMEGCENFKKLGYVKSGEVDYTDAREKLQVLENSLGLKLRLKQKQFDFARPQRAAEIEIDGEKIGWIAEFSEEVSENWGLENTVTGFEVDLEKLSKYF